MASGVLGRTNRVFPSIWLGLGLPDDASDLDRLVEAALASGLPMDISSQPALWGGRMRGTEAVITASGNLDYENATDESHATSLVQANLIEVLSSIGREMIDIYFLRVRRMAEEFQISGVLQALEWAKQEGHVGHIALSCDGPSFATLGVWQFHDAFEALLVPRDHLNTESYDTLAPLAKHRRVGIVTSKPLDWSYSRLSEVWREQTVSHAEGGLSLEHALIKDLAQNHPVLVQVKTPEDVESAIRLTSGKELPGLHAALLTLLQSVETRERVAK